MSRKQRRANAAAARKQGVPPQAGGRTRAPLTTSNPMVARLLKQAVDYHVAERFDEAKPLYESVLQLEPENAHAIHYLGVIAYQRGDMVTAQKEIRRALDLNPNDAEAWNNLGNAYGATQNYHDATACFRRAVSIVPDYAVAHYNLGNALAAQGQMEEMKHAYQQAITHNPNYSDPYYNLGNMLLSDGQLDEAVEVFEKATEIKPDNQKYQNNLAITLQNRGDLQRAVETYRKALAINPDFPSAWNNMAVALQALEKHDDAIHAFEHALHYNPDHAESVGQLVHLKQKICDWELLEDLWPKLVDVVIRNTGVVGAFSFLMVPQSTPALQLQCASQYVERELRTSHMKAMVRSHTRPSTQPERIKVGYLSGDFHDHATSYLIAEMFELHDRTKFEIYAYSYGPDDGSPIRQRIVKAPDVFRDIAGLSHEQAATVIQQNGIHILLDIKGYTMNSRPKIAALRPAPVQVNYLGYPGTMGGDFIDYIIADKIIIPPDQHQHYSENVITMPGCYQVNDSKKRATDDTPSRAECGLPEHGFVFCSFNQTYKITPQIFAIWMRLLKAVPDSVLWLFKSNDRVESNLKKEAEKHGVEASRLVFAPNWKQPRHLARYRHADLFLDTLPCNAHTTASDALWMDCPVLTCPGESFTSRVAASLLHYLGLDDMIMPDLDMYEKTALNLARSPHLLQAARERLIAGKQTSQVFNCQAYVKHFERGLELMWDNHQNGNAPKPFTLNDPAAEPQKMQEPAAAPPPMTPQAVSLQPQQPAAPQPAFTPPQLSPVAPPAPPAPAPAAMPAAASAVAPAGTKGQRLLEADHIAVNLCRHGLFAYNTHDSTVGQGLDLYGQWDEEAVIMCQQMLQDGDLVIEVGAGIGAHTVPLAKKVGKTGAVLAFEPERTAFQMLNTNVTLNALTNVHTIQQVAADEPGTTALISPDPEQPHSSQDWLAGNEQTGEALRVVTLDALQVPSCKLLKINTQDLSVMVMNGAQNMIEACQPIIYARFDSLSLGHSPIQILQDLGYKCWWHISTRFRKDNHFGNPSNVYQQHSPHAAVIAFHPSMNAQVSNLLPVENATETWQTAMERIAKMVG